MDSEWTASDQSNLHVSRAQAARTACQNGGGRVPTGCYLPGTGADRAYQHGVQITLWAGPAVAAGRGGPGGRSASRGGHACGSGCCSGAPSVCAHRPSPSKYTAAKQGEPAGSKQARWWAGGRRVSNLPVACASARPAACAPGTRAVSARIISPRASAVPIAPRQRASVACRPPICPHRHPSFTASTPQQPPGI